MESVVVADSAREGEPAHLPHSVPRKEGFIAGEGPDVLARIDRVDQPAGQVPGRHVVAILDQKEPSAGAQNAGDLQHDAAGQRIVHVVEDAEDDHVVEGGARKGNRRRIADAERYLRMAPPGVCDIAGAQIQAEIGVPVEERSEFARSATEIECPGGMLQVDLAPDDLSERQRSSPRLSFEAR